MSCYGMERGTIQIPSKEFKAFKDNMLSAYNSKLEQSYNVAQSIYKEMKSKKMTKGLNDLHGVDAYKLGFHFYWLLKTLLLKDGNLISPKKKDFVVKKQDNKLVFEDDSLTIVLDLKNKSVEYYSDDNNHSIDEARGSFLGQLFFKEIKKVKFSNRTGGFLKSETEYDKDEYGFSTGGSYSFVCGKYTNPKYLGLR